MAASSRARVVVRRTLTASDIWPEDEQVAPPAVRVAALRRLLPATRRDIVEARPDFWPDSDTGYRRLEKDLGRMSAVCQVPGRVWHAPPPARPDVDSRLVEPERIERARRNVRDFRPVLATDAAAVLASLDALLSGDGARRSEGARLLGEWVVTQGLSVRRAAGVLEVSHSLLSRWIRGRRRPRGAARQTIEQLTGVPAPMWDRPEQVVPINGTTSEA